MAQTLLSIEMVWYTTGLLSSVNPQPDMRLPEAVGGQTNSEH
jgi:hypothetical protein